MCLPQNGWNKIEARTTRHGSTHCLDVLMFVYPSSSKQMQRDSAGNFYPKLAQAGFLGEPKSFKSLKSAQKQLYITARAAPTGMPARPSTGWRNEAIVLEHQRKANLSTRCFWMSEQAAKSGSVANMRQLEKRSADQCSLYSGIRPGYVIVLIHLVRYLDNRLDICRLQRIKCPPHRKLQRLFVLLAWRCCLRTRSPEIRGIWLPLRPRTSNPKLKAQ